jgi:aspartate racemase
MWKFQQGVFIHCFETVSNPTYNLEMTEKREKGMPDRLIGILGGMGPEATLDLYRHILDLTPASKDQDHIRTLIYSNPQIPDRTLAIAGKGESPLASLVESARLLERAGAGMIAMPCNAAHYYLPEMQKKVGVPILDMVAETCSQLRRRWPSAKSVGLIASLGAVRSGVYQKSLAEAEIRILMPGDDEQQEIENGIAQVKAGIRTGATQEIFQAIGNRFYESGAGAVILGCTEVPLAFDPDSVSYPTLNSTRILAEASVDWALGKRDFKASNHGPKI